MRRAAACLVAVLAFTTCADAQTWNQDIVRGGLQDLEARADGETVFLLLSVDLATRPSMLLAEVDANGRRVRAVRTAEPSALYPHFLVATADRGVLVSGMFARVIGGSSITRLGADLSPRWQVALRETLLTCGIELPDGGFLVGGEESADPTAASHAVVVRLDARGTVAWDRSWVLPDGASVVDVAAFGDGGFAALVSERLGIGPNLRVFKVSASGQVEWQLRHDASAVNLEATGLLSRPDGSVIVSFRARVTTRDYLWLLTLAPDGTASAVQSYAEASYYGDGVAIAGPRGEIWTFDRVPTAGNLGFRLFMLDGAGSPFAGKFYDFGSFITTLGVERIAVTPTGAFMATCEDRGGSTVRLFRVDDAGALSTDCASPDRTYQVTSQASPLVPDATPSRTLGLRTLGWSVRVRRDTTLTSTFICTDLSGPPGEVSPPSAATQLRIARQGALTWEPAAASNSDTFCLVRGDIASLRAGDYGACLEAGLATPAATDPALPGPGNGWFYLVHGRNAWGDGTLGLASPGVARNPTTPCP